MTQSSSLFRYLGSPGNQSVKLNGDPSSQPRRLPSLDLDTCFNPIQTSFVFNDSKSRWVRKFCSSCVWIVTMLPPSNDSQVSTASLKENLLNVLLLVESRSSSYRSRQCRVRSSRPGFAFGSMSVTTLKHFSLKWNHPWGQSPKAPTEWSVRIQLKTPYSYLRREGESQQLSTPPFSVLKTKISIATKIVESHESECNDRSHESVCKDRIEYCLLRRVDS